MLSTCMPKASGIAFRCGFDFNVAAQKLCILNFRYVQSIVQADWPNENSINGIMN